MMSYSIRKKLKDSQGFKHSLRLSIKKSFSQKQREKIKKFKRKRWLRLKLMMKKNIGLLKVMISELYKGM
jgi:hypothetical protein